LRAPADPHSDERHRLLDRLGILDSDREEEFDEVVGLAARLCDAPVCMITLLDRDRQWMKAEVGVGANELPLSDAICAHAVHEPAFLEIPDLRDDPRTADNPAVTGEPHVRWYAGAVLRTREGVPLGTLCVLDIRPRRLTDLQRHGLRVLANQVTRELELRTALVRHGILLREIDHRVKNSLQSVGSMVRLQASRSDNGEVRDALATVAQRVQTVAAIHEQLHQASDGETVELSALFARAGTLFAEAAPAHLSVRTVFEPLSVDSSDAHSIAIVANEFVANAIKHAFPPERAQGEVTITGTRLEDGGYQVDCRDDGIGDTEALAAMDRSRGLGNRLIQAAVGSLRGSAEWHTEGSGLQLKVMLPPR